MKKALLIPVMCLLFVAAQAQNHKNVLTFGFNYNSPRIEQLSTPTTLSLMDRVEAALSTNPDGGNRDFAFTPIPTLTTSNPVFNYFIAGSMPIVYDPTLKLLFLIFNQQVDNTTTGEIGVALKIYPSVASLKSFSSTPKILATLGADYLGMPQLAVMNPDKSVSNVDSLHFLVMCRQYPKLTGYRFTSSTFYLRSSAAVGDPYPVEKPETNNNSDYKWGAGSLVNFSGGSSQPQGAVHAGVLSPPSSSVQYGQYGNFVYEASSQNALSSIPNSWGNSQFRSSPKPTSSYNGPMYVDADPKGTVYAAINALFADDQNNRVVAFSTSKNYGKTWSDFTRMPISIMDSYVASRGQSKISVVQPYQQDAFLVTGENRFSYFYRVALFDAQDSLRALDIVEAEYDNGSWTMRGISEFNDVPFVYVENDSVDKAANYAKMKPFRTMDPMGNELEAARTADGKSIVLKWIDYNPTLGVTKITPQQTFLVEDTQTGEVSSGVLDSALTTDVFVSSRDIGTDSWAATPWNLTNDKTYDKGTHMPRTIPSIGQIPIISSRSATVSGSDARSTMLKAVPAEFYARTYNLPSSVSYGLFAAVVPVEESRDVVLSDFSLKTPSPNPAVSETEITYTTIGSGHVNISVSNILGEKIASLLDANVDAGIHGFVYNTENLSAGSYYLTMTLNGKSQTRSFIVSR